MVSRGYRRHEVRPHRHNQSRYSLLVCVIPELMDTKDSEFKQKFVDSCCRNVFAIDPITQRVVLLRFLHSR